MDINFTGRTVLVTGAAGGFGAATARLFGTNGANVVVTDIDEAAAQDVASGLPSALALRMDVTDPESIRSGVEAGVERFGGLDVLVNNAGAPNRLGPLDDVDVATMDWLYNINLRSTYLVSQAALPHLRKGEASVIVNVASISAKRPRAGSAVYVSLKAGVETFTRALAMDEAPRVRVNSVSPVVSETGFIKNAMGTEKLSDEQRTAMVGGIPMGRTAQPEDIANAIYMLASDLASFQTGVCLDVDGGRSIG